MNYHSGSTNVNSVCDNVNVIIIQTCAGNVNKEQKCVQCIGYKGLKFKIQAINIEMLKRI